MPGHQPSQLGRATTDKATQASPLKVGSETTAVEQMAGRRARSGPTHRPIQRWWNLANALTEGGYIARTPAKPIGEGNNRQGHTGAPTQGPQTD